MYTLILNLTRLNAGAVIAIANTLSEEIDNVPADSLSQEQYDSIVGEMQEQFTLVCKELESRGIEYQDLVRCPENV